MGFMSSISSVAILAVFGVCAAGPVELTQGGRPAATIVVPAVPKGADANASVYASPRVAAELLRKYVRVVSGAEL